MRLERSGITPEDMDRRIFSRLLRFTRGEGIGLETADREARHTFSIVLPNGQVVVLDAERVLRHRVRPDVLAAALADPEGFDDSYMHEEARGRLKGGHQRERDRDFGIRDRSFWEWWHQYKQKNGYGDIGSLKEALELYEFYESERLGALRRGAFFAAIDTLPEAHGARLRAALTLISAC